MNLTVKTFKTNIEVFSNNIEETWHVSIDTDGLSINEELKADKTDEETIIDNWIHTDIETIENVANRKLTEEEKEEYKFSVITYYSSKI